MKPVRSPSTCLHSIIDWDDIQLLTQVENVAVNTNAGSAESDGVEVSLMFLPVERLKLSLTGAYTDAKLTEDALLVGGSDGDKLPYTPRSAIQRVQTTIGR